MAYRCLEINVISAKHLKDVNFISKMDVYVVVSVSGDDYGSKNKKQKAKTHVDRNGGSNPTWNFPVKFTVDESLAKQNRLNLVFKIKCDGLLGDKDVGEVMVPIKELLDSPGDGKSMRFVSYQVRKPSGKPKGELSFSYKFSGVSPVAATFAAPIPAAGKEKTEEPVMAYPAAMVAGSSSGTYGATAHAPYPPPPAGYPYPPPAQAEAASYGAYPPPPPQSGAAPYGGYPPPPPKSGAAPYGGYLPPPPQSGAAPYGGYPPPPPQPGYGYPPPPPPGYGYPGGYGYPPVQKPPKKSAGGMGMGLGAGLLGGMLGGLLIGDIVSDAADYDAGDFDF